ncbi:MAG TPA: ABC transporter ATP-binding protein [Dehalococcoidia bacterium]|nr:ABC transporter ATP-binding protein [Dehalococcoidia bacterium]
MEPKLRISGLTKAFPAKPVSATALEGVDLYAEEGEFVCIVGASGCGKSTLLSIVAGLTEPTMGEVLVDGERILGPGPDRGLVFQGYSLYPWRTVAQNVAFGLELTDLSKEEIRERVRYYLDVMNLTKWADARPSQLSGGMRQRVAIARSLVTEPEILLLDEPFGALDAQTRSSMQTFLRDLWIKTGTTILLVTHDVEEAIYLGQRVYVFASHPGRVKREIVVPFPIERGAAIRRDPQFLDLREEIYALLAPEGVEV